MHLAPIVAILLAATSKLFLPVEEGGLTMPADEWRTHPVFSDRLIPPRGGTGYQYRVTLLGDVGGDEVLLHVFRPNGDTVATFSPAFLTSDQTYNITAWQYSSGDTIAYRDYSGQRKRAIGSEDTLSWREFYRVDYEQIVYKVLPDYMTRMIFDISVDALAGAQVGEVVITDSARQRFARHRVDLGAYYQLLTSSTSAKAGGLVQPDIVPAEPPTEAEKAARSRALEAMRTRSLMLEKSTDDD